MLALCLNDLEVPWSLSALVSVLVPDPSETTPDRTLCRPLVCLPSCLWYLVSAVCVVLNVVLLLLVTELVLSCNVLSRRRVLLCREASELCREVQLPVWSAVSRMVDLLWVTSLCSWETRVLCLRVAPCSLAKARWIEVSPPLLLVCLLAVPLSVTCVLVMVPARVVVRDLSLLVCPMSTLGLLLKPAMTRLASDWSCLLVNRVSVPSCLWARENLR